MKNAKKNTPIHRFSLLSSLLVLGFVGVSSAAQVLLDPMYADPRFTPANAFHAGCTQAVDLAIKTENDGANSFRLIFGYDPKSVQVTSIKINPEFKDVLDSKIEDDKVTFTLLDTPLELQSQISLAQVMIKTNESATGTVFKIKSTSYFLTKGGKKIPVSLSLPVSIASAKECDPDIVPPTISLQNPSSGSGKIPLDTSFVFQVQDQGKGVDPKSLKIQINEQDLTGAQNYITRNKDQFTLQLPYWLPINKTMKLKIAVADKQIYGGANTGEKTFSFRTATGIVFEKDITPTMFRAIVSQADRVTLDQKTCLDITKYAASLQSDDRDQDLLFIAQIKEALIKANCSEKTLIQGEKLGAIKKQADKSSLSFSLFAVLGWGLFGVSLLLKLYYMIGYRKHKKLNSNK